MTRQLSVYLNNNYAGELVQDNSGQMLFTYSQTWLENPGAIPLSHSLPLQKETFAQNRCRGFFSGVLPEAEKRDRIARILGISARNDFALLEQIGGECAGAVTFLPVGETPDKNTNRYRSLSDKELADILRALPDQPLMAGEDDVRISLAGAQDKLAVMVENDRISIPLGNSISTHILKPAIKRFDGLVYNEAVCMQLARALEIPAAMASTHTLSGIDYLLVERYDRITDADGNRCRLHQEDFCQALGIVSELKYQSEGGPSLKQCLDLVRDISTRPAVDLKTLLDAVIFNFLIGNHDAHSKNFSLLYKDRQTELAPLYDLVCTVYYPALTQKMAMKIGGRYESKEVLPRHFEQMAKETGFSAPILRERVVESASRMSRVINQLKPSDNVSRSVLELIDQRCRRIQSLF